MSIISSNLVTIGLGLSKFFNGALEISDLKSQINDDLIESGSLLFQLGDNRLISSESVDLFFQIGTLFLTTTELSSKRSDLYTQVLDSSFILPLFSKSQFSLVI